MLVRDPFCASAGSVPLRTAPIPAWSPIFKQVTVHGFFLGNPDSAAAAPAAVRDVLPLVVGGALHTPISGVYPPSAIVEAAIHAERGGNDASEYQPLKALRQTAAISNSLIVVGE